MDLIPQSSGMSHVSAAMSSHSSASNLVSPHSLEVELFWWPGTLNLALWKALQLSVDGRDVLATVSWGFPKAPCGYRCLEPRLGIA